MTAIGDVIAEGREGKRTFYGWAVVTVENATRMRRSVRATPKLSNPYNPYHDNPYHADIDLHLAEGAERQDARIEHAKDLADRAYWKERFVAD